MGQSGSMNDTKKEFKKSGQNAGHINDLRFCGENQQNIYSWIPDMETQDILVINAGNIYEKLNEVRIEKKYACIILDDVLSTVSDFCQEKGIKGFLQKCAGGLGKGGKLVISTANRIGVQYLSGKADDYTGEYFDGINNYSGDKWKKAFTKSELTALFQECGMKYIKFFYPYPNQNYVKEVFTEECFENYGYGNPYLNLSEGRFRLFQESSFYSSLIREGVAANFANAFCVVVSEYEQEEIDDIRYVKLNWDREERFQIVTVIKNKGTVEKYALNKTAEEHIQKMYDSQNTRLSDNIKILQGEYKEKKIVYPFLDIKSLDMLIADEIVRRDREKIVDIFCAFYKQLFENSQLTDGYNTEEFHKVFGNAANGKSYHCKAPANIDLICANVFCEENQYVIIDCEWIFPFLVPVEFVVWRAVNELYSKYKQLETLISCSEFMKVFSIGAEDEKVFLKWGSYFAYEYVKSDSLRDKACAEIPLSLKELHKQYLKEQLEIRAHGIMIDNRFEFDMGNGFEEQNLLYAETDKDGDAFALTLNIPQKCECRIIRWRPAFGRACEIRIQNLHGAEIAAHNAYDTEGEKYSFILGDAFFYFLPDCREDEIRIEGEMIELDVKAQRRLLAAQKKREDEEIEEIKRAEGELEQKLLLANEELKKFKRDNLKLQSDLESVLNSTIWRKTELLRRLKDGRRPEKKEVSESETVPVEEKGEIEPVTKGITQDMIRFCIDSVIISDDMMSVDGWVLCEGHAIDAAYLVLEDIFRIKREYPFQLCPRKDVTEALNIQIEGECGIHVGANYKSGCEQRIFLRILVEGNWFVLDTGKKIPITDTAEDGDFLLERYSEAKKLPDYNECRQFCEEQPGEIKTAGWSVDVIVPVYNGMQYLPGLFESMERTEVAYRLILIEDCSPDERVRPYLREYAKEHNNVVLLENSENLGFVKSVNLALRMVENHVALVNTDVVLPKNWLERLMAPIFSDNKTASATPFTNSATIFSFPDFDKDNVLFMNLEVDEIDSYFAKISPRYVETPTGVGFCMGMNQNAIKEIGILDEETFEKGYGEENDWCQRAIEAGYKNVYVENLFVHHNHGGSFPSETKKRLIEENGAKLLKKHPNYSGDVARFARKDPNKDLREFVKFEIMFRYQAPFVLAFDHNLGGGASDYLKQKMQEQISNEKIFGIVRNNMLDNTCSLEINYGNYQSKMRFQTRKELVNLLKQRNYEQVWINELATYHEVEKWIEDIEKLRETNADSLRLLIHDYFMVCPSLNLMNADGKYCRLPKDNEMCDECLKSNDFSYNSECKSLKQWRELWGGLIEKCDEVIAFSQDSVRILKEIYPQVDSVSLIPHVVEPLEKVRRKHKATPTYNIGVLGAISEQKGLKVIRSLLERIEERHMDMKIVIIGESSEKIDSPAFSITGRYKREEIPELTIKNDIDVFMIPSVWPETFSYTTSEIMSMGMPIAVFDLGAPAERVKDYPKGMILHDVEMDRDELIDSLYEFARQQAEDIDS